MTIQAHDELQLILMCALYLAVDKALGALVLMGWGINRLANGFIKTTVCINRPWIRDPRVLPLESALVKATGYSFPSGHTTNAVAIFGGPAIWHNVQRGLRVALVLLVALVGLSRNWVGVHTPQDVLVAMALGAALMYGARWICAWIEERPSRDALVAAVGILASGALLAYAALKDYPMEYGASGELLVDPAKMASDSFRNAGWALGFFAGWLAERRLVGFTVSGTPQRRVQRALWGAIGILVLYYPVAEMLKLALPGGAGVTIACMLETCFVTLVMPWLIMHLEQRTEEPSDRT